MQETSFVFVVDSLLSSRTSSSIINLGSEIASIEDVESLELCKLPTSFKTLEGDECEIVVDVVVHCEEIAREAVGGAKRFKIIFEVSSSKI